MRDYLDSLWFRSGVVSETDTLNKLERFIHTIDYWLVPFRIVKGLNIKQLYDTYSELFLINNIAIGKYRNIMKG